MNIVLYDDPSVRDQLLPLTYTRPIAEFRVGILKIVEKWQHITEESNISFQTAAYLSEKFKKNDEHQPIYINGSVLPSLNILDQILHLDKGKVLVYNDLVIASSNSEITKKGYKKSSESLIDINGKVDAISHPWDIFRLNRQEIINDFQLLTNNRISRPIEDPYTRVYGKENVFLEDGAVIKAATINAENGPVYIGKNAVVGENSFINGAFALCEGGHVNACANIKGDTTIGPHSKVGGEVSNSVIFGYSNKGHEGFLGNSVLGEWCNLGADTNTSNLKNNYSKIRAWDYKSSAEINTGLQFCGLIMGDHSKAGINTMFNTATVVGVCTNVFGGGFPPKFIPSFSWGGAHGFVNFKLDKASQMADAMMGRRGLSFDKVDLQIFENIEKMSQQYK